MIQEVVMVEPSGLVRCVYFDGLAELLTEGVAMIARASHVEPGPRGWYADINNGPLLGPYRLRHEAIKAEVAWLMENWLQAKGVHDVGAGTEDE